MPHHTTSPISRTTRELARAENDSSYSTKCEGVTRNRAKRPSRCFGSLGFRKVAGSLDIELDDRTGDDAYLTLLADALPRVIDSARPDLVIYLAGADPHEHDRLGRLSLTFDGLARRDSMVLEQCREVGIPVAVTIAGGYGDPIADTVQVHVTTASIAARYSRS